MPPARTQALACSNDVLDASRIGVRHCRAPTGGPAGTLRAANQPPKCGNLHRMTSSALTRGQRLIIITHAVLALLYGALIPPYEAHDETGHFAYIQHVLSTHTLPGPRNADKAFLDQSHQPPAYYLLAAAALFWTDRSDYAKPERNIFALDGSNRRGVRILLRQPGEDFPWRGSILALHAARAFSSALSIVMLLLIAASARLLFVSNSTAALLATALAAFNPQVIFMAAMVNNDIMVSLCGAVAAYALLRMTQPGESSLLVPLALGLALGLSIASKNSALALAAFGCVAAAWVLWRKCTPWGTSLRQLVALGIGLVLISGPHVARNQLLEGRWLLDRTEDSIAKLTPAFAAAGFSQGLQDAWLPRIFVNAFRTFWGTFGWGSVQQPDWAYHAYLLVCVAGLLGLVLLLRRADRSQRTGFALLGGLAFAMLLIPTYRAIAFQDPALLPGRYLMPSLSAYVLLLGGGLALLLRSAIAHGTVIAALGLWAALIPVVVLRPNYAPVLSAAAADSPAPLLRYRDATGTAIAELRTVDAQTVVIPDREGPRTYARVRLTWHALQATAEPLVIGVSTLGYNGEVLGTLSTFPQRGNYPSTVWQAGTEFTDSYDILLEKPCAQLPTQGRVAVTLFTVDVDPVNDGIRMNPALPATDANGTGVNPLIGRFKISALPLPYPIHWQEPAARFAGALGLREVTVPHTQPAGQALRITANYEVLGPLARDATVFVHALDAQGQLVAQDDHAPNGGTLPLSLMEAGECAREAFTLHIPPQYRGQLRLVTGWYDATGRLAVTGQGAPNPDGLAELGSVEIVAP